MAPLRVAIACSGLDHVARGYETYARGLADVLERQDDLDIVLLKGSGSDAPGEEVLACLRRDGPMLDSAAGLLRRPSLAYELEATTFGMLLVRSLRRRRIDVLVTSDKPTAYVTAIARGSTPRTRILFTNGGPYRGPFPYAELVHHLTDDACTTSLRRGESADRSVMVPLGFNFRRDAAPTPSERSALRTRLRLPERPILISVGALDLSHKRHDHLARAVRLLPEPRPYLLLLGQRTAESAALERMMHATLDSSEWEARTVPADAVIDHCAAANVFALASIVEGFPHAYAEAASIGLPCVVHDFAVAREVLGPWGLYTDMHDDDTLSRAIARALSHRDPTDAYQQATWIRERYSWSALEGAYVSMVRRCASMPVRSMQELVPHRGTRPRS